MAGSASDYLEVQMRAHIFRTASWTKPAHLWVRLYTATPSDAGGGTEVAVAGYTAQQLDPADANWSAPDNTGGLTANQTALNFGTFATQAVVTQFAIWDAQTNGNMLFWGDILVGGNPGSMTIAAGETCIGDINALQVVFS